ncbi:MAG: DUF192 domain-containing protein, partial [Sphingomicrobium sp.]
VAVLIAAAILAACTPEAPASRPANDPGAQQGLREIPLVIRTAARVHRFTVEVAASAEEQSMGMMHRRSLPPNRGMLFPFANERVPGFWMLNTLIPLDMLFVRADGTIANIVTATPLSLDSVVADGPVVAVLEIGGGRAAELGIRAGDRVEYRL